MKHNPLTPEQQAVIRSACTAQGLTLEGLGRKLGKRNPNMMYRYFGPNAMTCGIAVLRQMCDELDLEIIIKPKG